MVYVHYILVVCIISEYLYVYLYSYIYIYLFTFLAEFDETTHQIVKSQNLRLVVLARGQAILPIKEDVQLLYVARFMALKEFL